MHTPHSMDRGLRITGSVVLLALSIAGVALDPVTRILSACLGLYGLGTGVFNYCPLADLITREKTPQEAPTVGPEAAAADDCAALAFFDGWTHREIGVCIAHAQITHYEKNTALIERGSAIDRWYVIIEGRVEQIFGNQGSPPAHTHVLAAGDCFGEEAFLRSEPSMYTVRALSAVRTLEISADSLRDVLASDPELGARLLYSTCAAGSARMRMLKKFFLEQTE